MCVHLFGAVSSPSIANYIVKRIGADSAKKFGDDVRKVMEQEFYVDNLLTSSPSDMEAISLLSRTDAACTEGGFNLRKVSSNSHAVIESVPKEKRPSSLQNYEIGKMLPIERALGVVWNIELDELGFCISIQDSPLTRLNILRTIGSIHDPLGLISPFLLKGRKILQALSADCYSWDDIVQAEHRSDWTCWRSQLVHLKQLNIKRCYKPRDFGVVIRASLHHFCDANSFGYGIAVYLRQVSSTGKVCVSLVMGKSRVTPLKSITIPRLELNSCVLAAEVGAMVKSELGIDNIAQVFWTDSKICLGYITNVTKRFRIFVANRQQKIHGFTKKCQWHHVDSSNNPADHASRGISMVKDHRKIKEWLCGPQLLWQCDEPWTQDSSNIYDVADDDPEVKVNVKSNVVKVNSGSHNILSHLETRKSRWKDMVRIMAWVHKFFRKNSVRKPLLSVEDTSAADVTLLRLIQANAFEEELAFYKETEGTVPKKLRKGKGNIWRLGPFVDSVGLLRVGGRIRKSSYTDADKHPIILPKNSLAVQRILEHYHALVHHGGRPATLNDVRSHGFWIISGNAQVKKLIHNCVPCRKYRGKLGEQKMADLPEKRTLEVAPFTHCGVDLFGPFKVKDGRKQCVKFVALFTCLSSRAIHLESVGNLTSDLFILALRRFLARRGPISSLRSATWEALLARLLS